MSIFALVVWLILAFLVAAAGEKRKIGSVAAFFCAIFLSPLIGFLIVLSSDKKVIEPTKDDLVEQAKKHAFKGESKKAISIYLDLIYKRKKALEQNEGRFNFNWTEQMEEKAKTQIAEYEVAILELGGELPYKKTKETI